MSLAREVLNMLYVMTEQSLVMEFWRKTNEQQRETDYSSAFEMLQEKFKSG